MSNSPVVVSDPDELLRYGVCRVPIPGEIDWKKWATELSKLTPAIMAAKGDGEYAFYRNILQEPDFPFDAILSDTSAIGRAIQKYFAINNLDEIRLDDAFCIHYNTSQQDSSGAKHMDPSDITVNMCLEKTDDLVGSEYCSMEQNRCTLMNNRPNAITRMRVFDFSSARKQDMPHCTGGLILTRRHH